MIAPAFIYVFFSTDTRLRSSIEWIQEGFYELQYVSALQGNAHQTATHANIEGVMITTLSNGNTWF